MVILWEVPVALQCIRQCMARAYTQGIPINCPAGVTTLSTVNTQIATFALSAQSTHVRMHARPCVVLALLSTRTDNAHHIQQTPLISMLLLQVARSIRMNLMALSIQGMEVPPTAIVATSKLPLILLVGAMVTSMDLLMVAPSIHHKGGVRTVTLYHQGAVRSIILRTIAWSVARIQLGVAELRLLIEGARPRIHTFIDLLTAWTNAARLAVTRTPATSTAIQTIVYVPTPAMEITFKHARVHHVMTFPT
jgi:hypothetical protein